MHHESESSNYGTPKCSKEVAWYTHNLTLKFKAKRKLHL